MSIFDMHFPFLSVGVKCKHKYILILPTLSSFICMFIYKCLGCLIVGFCLKYPTVAPPCNIKPDDRRSLTDY